ncbi:AMP-binding protein [Aliiglaciecola sp. CAU 1673]|uniref:phenylacetate--CoA ligase family protein n=1 Tax=Aliiglaciecola sp. CAU 1673 TaxID=3032595 RepID=UPI0023DC6209|nr:AMP-binding protein [Aliiglaciecola sp. CAU 1673]MDF2177292.1 AMP-binding protein [Aliiglaciecola sp. CAU 1673]
MALYTQLVSRLLFPLHEKLKGHSTVQKREALERSQWQTGAQISASQEKSLEAFLLNLSRHNPYFRALFSRLDITAEDFANIDVLKRIPLLDKATIRENEKGFVSELCQSPHFMTTSGSSGTPLRFVLGKERISHDVAAKWRATRWWGVDIGDPEAVIWGSSIELSGQGWAKVLRDRLFRSRLFPAKQLDAEGMDRLLDDLQSFEPAMIYGYPSILTMLAEHANSKGIVYRPGRLKVIFCTAEKLYPHQRQTIETFFGVPVANGYGSRDAGFIAHECPEGGLHISAEDIIVEVLDELGNDCKVGEIGELVVTHLCTSDFPMLRYRTGDLATMAEGPCACGRGLPRFADVIGRSNDVLRATNGAAVHGAYIGNIVREDRAVCHFQMIQESDRQFELKLVNYPDMQIDVQKMATKLKKVLGDEADISIDVVQDIPAEATGKYKYIINRSR